METNGSTLWRTVAIALGGILVGLGGTMLTVELRLSSTRMELTQLQKWQADTQLASEKNRTAVDGMRLIDESMKWRLEQLEKIVTRLENTVQRMGPRPPNPQE